VFNKIAIFLLLCLSSIQFSFAGDPDLFYYVSDTDDNLYSVDRTTGTVTLIGATGVTDIEAIAYYPVPGANLLYAANGGDIGTLNLTTGAYTFIAEVDGGTTINGVFGTQTIGDIDGLMLDGRTFKLWASERNATSDLIFQIDPATGQVVRSAFGSGIDYIAITGTGGNIDVDDIAISPATGRMYAINNGGGVTDDLLEINKFTGTFSVVSSLSEDDIEGLAFHNDGTLYASEGDDNRMSTVAISTGVMSSFIALTGGDPESLASLVADANTVSGNVFDDTDLDGVLDGGETGVANVTIYLYIDNNSDGLVDPEDTRVQTTTTDVNGDYSFYFASTGSLLVTTEYSSYPASSALTTDNIETASFTDAVNFAETDASNNFGIGTGADCDGDGLPNFYEGALDSDGDAVLDSCDLDSDNDGIRDDVEGIEDFDDDGIPDYRDRDSDDDGIPDAIEANRGTEPTGYSSAEGNISGAVGANGIVDAIETAAESGIMLAPNPDSDNDGNRDYLDLDSDNDGILDIIEAGGEDSDNDGQVDGLLDTDNNGLDDRIETTPLAVPNTDATYETANSLTARPNYIDIDSDADGIDDTREGYSTVGYEFPSIVIDSDEDGILDFWDVSTFETPITPYDKDSDDIPDYIDTDSDNDGISDFIEGNDANNNGAADVANSGVDANGNGLDDAFDGDCGEASYSVFSSSFAEENNADGSVDIGSSDLELVTEDENQTVGLRFTNVELDSGEVINSAFIQFETDEVTVGAVSITIQGQLSSNAADFTTTVNDVSNLATRPRTVATVTWTPNEWDLVGEKGTDQLTVDIGTIVQEIVNQAGWVNGNSMVFIFTGATGNTRIAENDATLSINTAFDATPTYEFVAADYAEEDNTDGSVDLGSSDLELPNETNNQTVGLLFAGITLSQGQTITAANIQFQTDDNGNTEATTMTIRGELSRSSIYFTTTVNDVSNATTRPRTSASASWSPAAWNTIGEAGTDQLTSSLTTIAQEIVDQNVWDIGNNMTFFFTGPAGSAHREAETNPTLIITTTASFTICASNVVHQDFDGDGEDDFRDADDDADGIPTVSEQTDVDLSGTVDYLESDASTCGVGYVTGAGTNTGNADIATNENGITNSGNATGAADGTGAELHENGDILVLDLTDIVPAGESYTITWRERPSQTGTASMVLQESIDGTNWTAHPSPPTTNSTTFVGSVVTANVPTRYLRISKDDPPSGTDFQIDAITYTGTTDCVLDSDNDGVGNDTDIDDDNDGVLDVNEGNGSNNPVGDEDGDGTLNFEDTSDGGSGDGSTTDYTDSNGDGIPNVFDFDSDGIPNHLDLDSDNDGIPDLQEAGGIDTDSDGRVDDPTDTDVDGWANTFDATDGGTALADGDKDGDSHENRLDLDADNDGIADIIEAGGTDSNNDGVVDSATDTDGDGFADTFDSDNAGSPLPITDEDGDGIQNYQDLDSDGDGLTDNVEGQTTASFVAPLGTDTDGDGWDNRYDSDDGGTAITLSNNEGFGNPDYLDDDSDGDGLRDWIEGFDDDNSGDALNDLTARATTFETNAGSPGFYVNADDGDGDGIPDWLEDDDGDNVPNFQDPDHGDFHDTDNDGIVDLFDTDNSGAVSNTPDGDGDGEYDFRDTDDVIALPISLVSFTAFRVDNKVQLNWVTETEINNDYFTIERLNEQGRFEAILMHNGAGNSIGLNEYQLFDKTPRQGYNYYRLRQTDFDGKTEVFNIVPVYFDGKFNITTYKVFPNPTNGSQLYLELNFPETGEYKYEVISEIGTTIFYSNFYVESESQTFKLNLLKSMELTAGFYFIKLTNDKEIKTLKFIVK